MLIAIFAIYHQMRDHELSDLWERMVNVPLSVLMAGLGFTIAGYLVLGLHDWVALRYLSKNVPYKFIALAAFIAFAVTRNVGHGVLSGTPVRYRFYMHAGLTPLDALKVSLLDTLTFALGLCSLLLAAYGMGLWQSLPMEVMGLDIGMMVLSAAYIAYLWIVFHWQPQVRMRQVTLTLPDGYTTLRQIAVGALDVLLHGLVLYVFISGPVHMPAAEFFVLFVLAKVLGIFSQVPGGIGVFEGVFLAILPGHYAQIDVLAAMLLYRGVYYFLPLLIAGLALLAYEVHSRGHVRYVLPRRARS